MLLWILSGELYFVLPPEKSQNGGQGEKSFYLRMRRSRSIFHF